MKSRYFAYIYVLIIASFVVAPLAQSWGDSYGIPHQKMLYDTVSERNAVALTTTSDTGIQHVSFWNYGKLRAEQWRGPNRVIVSDLIERWGQYDVYYEGWIYDNPSAVFFDPKTDDRKIISDTWVPIKDQVELSMLVKYISSNYGFHPDLWRVLGPDNDFYGYMYSAWGHVHMKEVGERTLWVDDLPLAPYDPIHYRQRSVRPKAHSI